MMFACWTVAAAAAGPAAESFDKPIATRHLASSQPHYDLVIADSRHRTLRHHRHADVLFSFSVSIFCGSVLDFFQFRFHFRVLVLAYSYFIFCYELSAVFSSMNVT